MLGTKSGVTPLGNEYFRNDAEAQNKAAEWVGYFLPVPLFYTIDKKTTNKLKIRYEQY